MIRCGNPIFAVGFIAIVMTLVAFAALVVLAIWWPLPGYYELQCAKYAGYVRAFEDLGYTIAAHELLPTPYADCLEYSP